LIPFFFLSFWRDWALCCYSDLIVLRMGVGVNGFAGKEAVVMLPAIVEVRENGL
jgi:hypothetical protein